MEDTAQVWFPPFRLDVASGLLWHEDERCALSPKAFSLLCYFVAHPEQLVSKRALLDAVWPDTVVGDGALTVAIAELRKVLGDDPRTPRFIETVHRRGYRWLALLRVASPVQSSQFKVQGSSLPPTADLRTEVQRPSQLGTLNSEPETLLVGRIIGDVAIVFIEADKWQHAETE